VTDATGLITTLSYDLAADATKITKVTDPYGPFATLTYNPAGELASITDVIGLTWSFVYGSGNSVSNLTTPHGPTRFTHESDPSQTNAFRFIQATDPLGGTERVDFR
jgi:YD repeat-containing protein